MSGVNRFRGMFLAEACGDALGFPLEKLSVAQIVRQYGPYGLRTLVRLRKDRFEAQFSAGTQLMLAAADGILWADAKALDCSEGIYRGYMRWYYSQTGEEPRRGQRTWLRRQPHERDFCLVREKFMHTRRSGGEMTLAALSNAERGSLKNHVNDAQDSEALARSGPIGLFCAGRPKEAFYEGVRCALLTHTHPVSYISAAALAALIAALAGDESLPKSLAAVAHLLSTADHTDEVMASLEAAIQQANAHPAGKGDVWDHLDSIHSLGTGDAANEALAIAVYCVMACDDPFEAVVAAANHGGRSSVTAAAAGAIEGVRFGESFLPGSWLEHLERADFIGMVGDKVCLAHDRHQTGNA